MLLSITIETSHLDAQADALTAIKLLQNTFWAGADISALRRHSDDSADDPAAAPEADLMTQGGVELKTVDEVHTPISGLRLSDLPIATITGPIIVSNDSTPPPVLPRALIPGTNTYVPVDVNGLPWDKRIHASSQARTTDGSWRRKPKVPEEEFQRVTDELRAIMQAPAAGAPVPEEVEGADGAWVEGKDAPPPITPAEAFAQMPPPQVLLTQEPAPAPEPPMDFNAFASWAGVHAHHQRLKYADMERVMRELGLVNAEGVGSLALIAHRPDLIPEAHARLSALIAAEGAP